MGVDIYLYAERRQPDGSWALASGMEKNTDMFLGGEEHYPDENSDPYPPRIPKEAVEVARNYELFAILANVRNGLRTADHQHFECIALPRGLPADLSPELREFTDLWNGGFAHTWLLLEEILNFPWKEKTMLHEAMVDRGVAHLFKGSGPIFARKPRLGFPFEEWPADIPMSYSAWRRDGVVVRWLATYWETGRWFLEAIEPLRSLGDPAGTRLVFWFD